MDLQLLANYNELMVLFLKYYNNGGGQTLKACGGDQSDLQTLKMDLQFLQTITNRLVLILKL